MQSLKHILHLCLISGLLFLVSCAQEPQIPGKIVSFEDVFQLKNKIYLDENIKLKGIYGVNVDNKGHILLLDLHSNQVVLVNQEGKLIKNITPDSCHPGHSWKPSAANFNDKGYILVLTEFGEIYWFSNTGECITKGNLLKKGPSGHLAFDNRGNFYFRERNPMETYIHKSDSLGIKTSRFKIENPLPILTGFAGNGSIQSDGKNIWLPLTYVDGFHVYSQEGVKLSTIHFESPSYKAPQEDPKKRDTAKMLDVIRDISSLISFFKTQNGAVITYIHRHNSRYNPEKHIGISIYDQHKNKLRYVLTDSPGAFMGNDRNDLFYTPFTPSKEDIAQCRQCGIKTTMGLNVYQLKNN